MDPGEHFSPSGDTQVAPPPPSASPPAEYGRLRSGAHYATLVLSAMLGTLIRLGFMALADCASATKGSSALC